MKLFSFSNIASQLVLTAYCSGLAEAFQTHNARAQQSYSPVAYYLGTGPSIDGLQPYSRGDLTLDATSPVLTLDYGTEVGGFPFVQSSSIAGPTQIELKYSEPYDGLSAEFGDGPLY